MVARIKSTHSLSRSLNYNQKKVQLGVAECIHAVNYPKDVEHLNFYYKLHRLEHQAALNERVKANSVHISLNFHDSDKLSTEKLCSISQAYMKGIGFEKQPYLVYQHRDAGHPHIHIVSTNIQRDGSKISMNNIGRNQSEVARKAIEIEFGLTKAEGRKQQQESPLKVSAVKVQYGKMQTKRAITNVLDVVIDHYKYTSLPELNAILKQYNVMADRGKEDTKMFEKRGLVYTALDDKGNKIGTPIKASAFYSKPTLRYLEQKFSQNEPLRQMHLQKLKTAIKWVLVKEKITLNEFTEGLARDGIKVVLRQNAHGDIYGITYVDFRSKCVFNGSDLGKEFSAKAITEKCLQQQPALANCQLSKLQLAYPKYEKDLSINNFKENVLLDLLSPAKENDYLPHHFAKKKQKKKSKGLRF
ncbi:MAG TPA: relaxase/mobilization nuclease domain-containing protein [Chitinophagaceae bacterium]|jgi:hypothetical protein|nr:relaxase/mobilization nuclease domain-containing protein [Chitinophagaceae bacterium]